MDKDKVFAGTRLRRLREERGLSQVELARILVISASYLNQIEHDNRPLTVTVLVRLTEVFGIDPAFFAPKDTARQLAELREALPDALGGSSLPLSDLQQVAGTMPEVAEAVINLHRRHLEASTHLEALTDSRSGASTHMPHELVRDFIYRHQNYFDGLDRAAERLADDIGARRGEMRIGLRQHLENAHGIRVVRGRTDDEDTTYDYEGRDRTLTLAPHLRPGQQAFRMATQLAYLEAGTDIDAVLDQEDWPDATTRGLARIGLAHHYAGALVLPYAPFVEQAEHLRYDIEALSEHFGVGYETIAHRLSTLQRSGARGVPFIFVRVDRAGNISKRQSATGFHFSRSGGTCPLWTVYDAFTHPGRISIQVAEMPDGQRYLWIARTVTGRRGGYQAPDKTFVIGLGCELRHAGRLVYSAGLDLTHPNVTLIGPGCRTCDRQGCPQRAAPPIGRPIVVDESRGSRAPYPLQPS